MVLRQRGRDKIVTLLKDRSKGRLAGSRGTHATPMSDARRLHIYQWQSVNGELTPRQRRRLAKKATS